MVRIGQRAADKTASPGCLQRPAEFGFSEPIRDADWITGQFEYPARLIAGLI